MTKRKSVLVCLLIAMFSFLLFGCKQDIKVENIYFNAPSTDGVVLLVGETYTPEVYFSPRYPTNKAYKISSYNDAIVSVRNNQITALTAGKTYIQVVADENNLIQDIMQVQVVASVTKLSTPTITYSADKQSFTISQSNQDGFVNGYTIEINGESIDIGNVLEYSLDDYNKHLQSSTSTAGISAYDRNLTVRVKATVPSYTKAFEDSNFSQTIKINQASAPKSVSVVGGELIIEKSKATDYQVFVNDSLFTTSKNTKVELSAISKNLAGSDVNISVNAVGTAEDGFIAYNSKPYTLVAKCAVNIEAELVNTTISWQPIDGVASYEIYLNDQRLTVVNTNYYDLTTFANFETEFVPNSVASVLSVKPVLAKDSKNIVLSSEQIAKLNVNRLASPTIRSVNNIVEWDSVDNASLYHIKVVDSDNVKVVEYVTDKRQIDFTRDEFESGKQFRVFVNANFVAGETYYLASKQAELVVEKQAKAEVEINNYVLNLTAVLEEQYEVEIFDTANQSIFKRQFTPALTPNVQVNLLMLGIDFNAGKYTINITHLGNGSSKIDSETTQLEIVCLQEIDSINVENGVVTVVAGELNTTNNASIEFDLIKGGSVVESFENTINLNELDLTAGDYTINLYVRGNGSTTFSVKNTNGTDKICATHTFKVLETPTITTNHAEVKFDINAVANAVMYCVVAENDMSFVLPENLTFSFDLQSGERKEFAVQALGDGSTTINSQMSASYVFERLETPALNFDNSHNSLTTNISDGGYTLKLNEQDITSSYVMGSTVTGLVDGENIFELIALANDDASVTYINSLPKQLRVNKAQANSKLVIEGNKLIIEPAKTMNNMTLKVVLSSGENVVEFTENDFAQVNAKLDVKNLGTKYSITLLDEMFKPILSELGNTFNVKVCYLASHSTENSDDVVDTDFSAEQTIRFAPVATFAMAERDGQKISFEIETGYSYTDYVLRVNNTYLLELNNSVELDTETKTIKFNLAYIYNNVPADTLQEINKLQLVTLNNKTSEENLLLATLGDTLYVKKAQAISISGTKNNAREDGNNSVRISFNQVATDYERSVLVRIFNDIDDSANYATLLIDVNPTATSAIDYTFNLDDYGKNLSQTKKVVAMIKASSNYTAQIDGNEQTVYVFDSDISNELEYTIVENALVETDGTKLVFSLPENVAGVDVYKQTETGLVKLNTNLIIDSYNLGINDGSLVLFVRSVAVTTGNFTNSQLSEAISLTKLAQPKVSVENGMVVLSLDKKSAELFEMTVFDPTTKLEGLDGCVVRFVHGDTDEEQYIYKDMDGVSLTDGKLIIEPSVMLKYGVTALTKETIKFDVVAKQSTGELLLNSNVTTTDLYGLFAPTKVSLPAVGNQDEVKVQTLTFTDTGLNKLADGTDVLAGYILKVVDSEGNEYFSNANLIYLVAEEGATSYITTSYPAIITTNNIAFPYGYKTKDGQEESFKAGTYSVYIKAVPKSGVDGYNLCASKYSEVCKVTMLATPVLNIDNGVIKWDKIAGANEYVLTFEDIFDSSVKQTVVLTNNYFEFEGFDNFTSSYNVTVRAISNLTNIVNSENSKMICVHKLPVYESVTVDDGALVLKANGFFTQANLMFRNTSTGVTETIKYKNPSYQTNIEAYTNGNKQWADIDMTTVNAATNYVIEVDKSYLLKLSKGSYTLSVQLIGNTSGNLSIISSGVKAETSIINFTKLAFDKAKQNVEDKTWIRVDERGVFTFACPEEFALGGFNYQFNEPVTDVNYAMFKKVVVYKLIVKINNKPYEMFALDYKSFVANSALYNQNLIVNYTDAGTLCTVVKYPYVDINGETKYLYFNVFKDNQINLNLDNFYYFNTMISTKDGKVSLASGLNATNGNGYYVISLIEGGVFSVDLHILGCDITATTTTDGTINQAYLSSDLYSSKSFIRYTDNNLKSYISYTVTDKPETPTAPEQPTDPASVISEFADEVTDVTGADNGGKTDQPSGGGDATPTGVTYTYSGELIFQNKIKYDDNGNAVDYPVYQLEINPIVYYNGSAVEGKPYIYYLYHDEASVQKVIDNNLVEDCAGTATVKVEYLLNNKDYLKFDFSKYFKAGNYSIKIRTLAGVGTTDLDSKYLLNSRLPNISYSFKRLSDTSLTVVDGKLQFALAYVLNDRVKSYINDYELVIADTEKEPTEYTFKIGKNSEGVTISNNTLTYILPEKVQATNSTTNETAELVLQNGQAFNVKVRAVQTEEGDTGILNSTFVKVSGKDKVTAIEKSQGVETVKILDGAICCVVKDQANYNGTIIRIEFEDGRVVEDTVTAERTQTKEIGGQTYFYYEISDNEYTCIDGIGKSKINAGSYTLKLRTRGKFDSVNNVEILLSDYTAAVDMVRLAKVEANAIVSNDGILTWEHVDSGHISQYIVTLTGDTTYTFTTSGNSIDFATTLDDAGKTLQVGSYSITIRAIGSDYVTAMTSVAVAGFTKLDNVTTVAEDGDAITWGEVQNAQGYKVTFSWGGSESQQSITKVVKAEEGLKCVAPAEMSGSYTIKIQAVGVGTGKVFNGGKYVFEGSSERPESVGEIRFDETDLSLYIPVSSDFKTNDVLRISYQISAYSFNSNGSVAGNAVEQIVELTKANTEYVRVIDETTYFVYPLSTAGVYTRIAVNVVRKGSLSSVATPYEDIYFNYFASGDGSAENPYGIATSEHFLNIALKPNFNFVVLQSINLSDIDATAQITKYGALIANKFSGTLDGGDFAIAGLSNISISNNIANFEGIALFNQIENATIKNLNIAETDNNSTKLANIFAQQQSNVLKLSLIAMKATNSTLIDVSLRNAVLEISGSSALMADGYVGGLIAIATDTTFEGCVVNLTVKFVADFVPTSGNVYIGGLVAYATNITVNSSSARATSVGLTVEQTRVNRVFKAIGGVAGYTTTTTSSQINNVNATINQTTNVYAENFGGIVGHAVRTTISGATVLGNFVHTALGTINLGGVVGQLIGGSVDNCTIRLTFDLTIARNDRTYIGFVAGYLASSSGTMATISNCKINQTFTTKTEISEDNKSVKTMGIYGNTNQNNYNPTGCTQID